jgi:hypothetical protein
MAIDDASKHLEYQEDFKKSQLLNAFYGRAYKLYLSEADKKKASAADRVLQAMSADKEKSENQNEHTYSSTMLLDESNREADELNNQIGESKETEENILQMDKEKPIVTISPKDEYAEAELYYELGKLSVNDERLAAYFRSQNPDFLLEFDPVFREGAVKQLLLSTLGSIGDQHKFLSILNLLFSIWEIKLIDKFLGFVKFSLKEQGSLLSEDLLFFSNRIELFDKKLSKNMTYQDLIFQPFSTNGRIEEKAIFWWTIGNALCEVKTERSLDNWLSYLEHLKFEALSLIVNFNNGLTTGYKVEKMRLLNIDSWLFFLYRYVSRQDDIKIDMDEKVVFCLFDIHEYVKNYNYLDEHDEEQVYITRTYISNIRRYIRKVIKRLKYNHQVLKNVFDNYNKYKINNESGCFKRYIVNQIVNFFYENPKCLSESYTNVSEALRIDSTNFLSLDQNNNPNQGNIVKNLSHLFYNIYAENVGLNSKEYIAEFEFYSKGTNSYDTLSFSNKILMKLSDDPALRCKSLSQIINSIHGKYDTEFTVRILEFFLFDLSLEDISKVYDEKFTKHFFSVNCDDQTYNEILRLCITYSIATFHFKAKGYYLDSEQKFSKFIDLCEFVLLLPISQFKNIATKMRIDKKQSLKQNGELLYKNRKIERKMKKAVLTTIDKVVDHILTNNPVRRETAKSLLDLIARMAENKISTEIILLARGILRKFSIYGRPKDGFDFVKDPPVIKKKVLSNSFEFDFSMLNEKIENQNSTKLTEDSMSIQGIIDKHPYGSSMANEELLKALRQFYYNYRESLQEGEIVSFIKKKLGNRVGIVKIYNQEALQKLFPFDQDFLDFMLRIIQQL